MLIYKILRSDEWATLQANGKTAGAPIDIADGYVHFSTAETVAETAAKYFAGIDGLMLLAVEADKLDLLKWEPARKDVLFPHLYREFRLTDMVWHRTMPLVDGVHELGELT